MPELPEVENFSRALDTQFSGAKLKKVTFHRNNIRFPLNLPALHAIMRPGVSLLKVFRVGKQLCLEFETGKVFVSLGMSGAFVPGNPRLPEKHEHMTLVFQQKSRSVSYVDPRRFGFVTTTAPDLAADPLDPAVLKKTLLELQNKGAHQETRKGKREERMCKKRVKDALMDQKIFSGIGNIYASEACFLARVSPLRLVCDLSLRECAALAKNIPQLMQRAIEKGGSSISTYRRFGGEAGSFQDVHQVYGREGEKCLRAQCAGIVMRMVTGGRSSFFCGQCQR